MFVPYDTSKEYTLSSYQQVDAIKESTDRDILSLNGVNVEQFTRSKAIADLKEFFEWFCPQIKDWDIDYTKVDVFHEFQPMCKTAIPKNVVKIAFQYNTDKLNLMNRFSIYYSYLEDGCLNSADAIFWVGNFMLKLKVRLKKQELVITEIKTSDMENSKSAVAFKDNSPSDNVVSSQILDKCWLELMSQETKGEIYEPNATTINTYMQPDDYVSPVASGTPFQESTENSSDKDSAIVGCIAIVVILIAVVFGIFSCTSCGFGG